MNAGMGNYGGQMGGYDNMGGMNTNQGYNPNTGFGGMGGYQQPASATTANDVQTPFDF